MSFDLECPYCKADIEPCAESRDPDQNIEHECPECEKTFIYEIEYLPTYTARIAPCLNGGEHVYKPIMGWPKEYFVGRMRCAHCDHETEIAAKEPA